MTLNCRHLLEWLHNEQVEPINTLGEVVTELSDTKDDTLIECLPLDNIQETEVIRQEVKELIAKYGKQKTIESLLQETVV